MGIVMDWNCWLILTHHRRGLGLRSCGWRQQSERRWHPTESSLPCSGNKDLPDPTLNRKKKEALTCRIELVPTWRWTWTHRWFFPICVRIAAIADRRNLPDERPSCDRQCDNLWRWSPTPPFYIHEKFQSFSVKHVRPEHEDLPQRHFGLDNYNSS